MTGKKTGGYPADYEPLKHISLKVKPADYEEMKAVCDRLGISTGAGIRLAVSEFLKKHRK